MVRQLLILFLFGLIWVGQEDRAWAAHSEPLQNAINRYEYGSYAEAAESLYILLYPITSLDQFETETAHAYLGVCFFLTEENAKARAEFTDLLELNPDYRLDPVIFPPKIVDFFNEVRNELFPDRADGNSSSVFSDIFQPPKKTLALTFFPFGAGQFQNRDTSKGIIFLSTELLLGATSAYYYFERKSLEKSDSDSDGDNTLFGGGKYENTGEAEQMQNIQMITGTAFWVVLIWGIADAVYNFDKSVEGTQSIQVGLVPEIGPVRSSFNLTFSF
jgi:hypothetical protein